MNQKYFSQRPELKPVIYVYELPNASDRKGLLKIGYTTRDAKSRIKEQLGTAGINYNILLEEDAIRNDGSTFDDHEIHRYLRRKGFANPDGEWFACRVKDVKAAILAIKNRTENIQDRIFDFKMRPEQKQAVLKTSQYFNDFKKENKNKSPRFLWNAKMRFGKTFASYQLARKMGFKKILVLTFKPAVENAWEDDLMLHKDFEGWQFYSKNNNLKLEDLDKSKPFVVFGSFQDFLGKNSAGGIKEKNKWVHDTNWDIIIFDEYHWGAWREGAKDLFDKEEDTNRETDTIAELAFKEGVKEAEKLIPIKTKHYLYLSGTPFRAIETGEFIEDQIFNWTYSDEQNAKENWDYSKGPNPYESLPKMIMMTYRMPDSIKHIAQGGEFDEFDLNIFFSAKSKDKDENKIDFDKIEFVYKDYVQKWLDLIRGSFLETAVDDLKLGAKKPPFPFSDARLQQILTHTFWFLPSVASCYAMRNLMKERQNTFYHDYKIVVAAGTRAGIGLKALEPVKKAMDNPLKTKTITLSTGKLTTGVTVRPWSGVLMLRNLKSPETYFQTAFRVQSPWVVDNPDGKSPNKKEILKKECYIFDFAPNRALSQVADYSSKLNVKEDDPEKKVEEFIKFLPILAYDGSSMKEIDAKGILDMVMSGTTATLLARRWESALLVNVDNETLQRLMANEKAMEVLMNIEGFRSLNQDIETIINKSESVNKLKTKANEKELTKKEKKQLTEEEKEYKNKRKQIQQKLIKFATRIPIFMYLTDYRERTLKDVITKLEPSLFKKVTGLTVKDFELLVSLNVFNSTLMNDAVYKFKRYEDSSLEYTGINRHEGEKIGGYDTVKNPEKNKK
ncbi:GIY-YIG nuclease family protein [Methanococcus aeolicus]|uniref:GIY-YIG nuclease family protein n=1 Tax=Methanococcus aeolicus TaxID=42879 RepID=UPI0021C57682|nr:GIY-YIG nuclease family protein [Methanococcus aeolicus]UXM84077.1 DEAD/DEAH box helicase family protein [Methanococcus aeolicus]